MLDDRFERDIQAALLARDPGPTPRAVFDRVEGVPDRGPGTRLAAAVRTVSHLGAIGAAAMVLLAVAGILLLSRSLGIPVDSGPGVGSSPGPGSFDPTMDGVGIVAGPTGLETALITVIAIAGAVIAAAYKRLPVRMLVLASLAVLVVTSYAFSKWDAIDWEGGAWAPGIGYVGSDPSAAEGSVGGDPLQADFYVVPPNGVLTFGFDVHNRAALPITILGLAPDNKGLAWGRITAAGMLRDPRTVSLEPADTQPFAPIRVEPNGYAFLVIVGRASPCALGRDNRGDEFSASAQLNQVDIVYEMLAFRKQTSIELPATVNLAYESDRSRCDASEVLTSPAP